jgi:hypothetical protein
MSCDCQVRRIKRGFAKNQSQHFRWSEAYSEYPSRQRASNGQDDLDVFTDQGGSPF